MNGRAIEEFGQICWAAPGTQGHRRSWGESAGDLLWVLCRNLVLLPNQGLHEMVFTTFHDW